MKRHLNRFIAVTLIAISIISMFPPVVSSAGSKSVNEMLTDTKGYDLTI